MPSISAYHRPQTLDEAVGLLADPDTRALAGGTLAVPAARSGEQPVALVDLQALDLDGVDAADGRLRIGAMTRLGDLAGGAAGGDVGAVGLPDLLATLARRELPSTLRNAATIGGTIAAAEADSVLLAGLLVHDAIVEFHDADSAPLAGVLASGVGGRLIVSVTVEPDGTGVVEGTGRTPADVPIVAAVGRRSSDGGIRLALTGVADVPVLAAVDDPTSDLDPRGDFRGSADYRRHLAEVLSARVRVVLA